MRVVVATRLAWQARQQHLLSHQVLIDVDIDVVQKHDHMLVCLPLLTLSCNIQHRQLLHATEFLFFLF